VRDLLIHVSVGIENSEGHQTPVIDNPAGNHPNNDNPNEDNRHPPRGHHHPKPPRGKNPNHPDEWLPEEPVVPPHFDQE